MNNKKVMNKEKCNKKEKKESINSGNNSKELFPAINTHNNNNKFN